MPHQPCRWCSSPFFRADGVRGRPRIYCSDPSRELAKREQDRKARRRYAARLRSESSKRAGPKEKGGTNVWERLGIEPASWLPPTRAADQDERW